MQRRRYTIDLQNSIFKTIQVADLVPFKIPDVITQVTNSVLTSTIEAYKELAKTMKSAPSPGDIILISRATTPAAASQISVIEYNIYENHFIIHEAANAKKRLKKLN